jgi:hypothetical protein
VARHASRLAPGPRTPALALLFIAATAAQTLDGLTRLFLPAGAELNPLSAAVGGPASLLLKLGIVVYCAVVAARVPDRRWVVVVLAVELVAGGFGTWSNLVVLL